MSTAKPGDKVVVHYTGKLDDGSVFDTSKERGPLEVTLGQQGVIAGFQEAVVGMEPGDTKTATVPADKAYGTRKDELVIEFGRDAIPQNLDPQVGQELNLQTQGGQSIPARVIKTDAQSLTVDANHPLAGHDLTFELELVEIK